LIYNTLGPKKKKSNIKDFTKQLLLFKGLSDKKNEAGFNGGEVNSDTGPLFFLDVENRIGLLYARSHQRRAKR